MKDRDFLIWIHERLVKYGDSPYDDFLHKLRCIIAKTSKEKETPNLSRWNNIDVLKKELNELS